MRQVFHQTARLAPGRHRSPRDGICTMELVSLLAGTTFSDRCPRACPAIAAFVRGYNDHIDDCRRQDLLLLAPDLVDTRADEEVKLRRAERCLAFGAEAHASRRFRL